MKNLLKLKFLWSFLTLFLVLSLIVGGCGKKEKKERAKSATKQEAVQKASEEKVHENKYYFSNQPNLSLILLTKKENIK